MLCEEILLSYRHVISSTNYQIDHQGPQLHHKAIFKKLMRNMGIQTFPVKHLIAILNIVLEKKISKTFPMKR